MIHSNMLYIKIIVVLIALILMNFIYTKTLFEIDIQTHSPIINLSRKVDTLQPEVIYLGESSNSAYEKDDVDKLSISEMIHSYFPKISITTLEKQAAHGEVYYELLRNISETPKLRTVIVTLNLRTFNINCIQSNLETAIQKSLILIKEGPPLYKRFQLDFKAYDLKTNAERERQWIKHWKSDYIDVDEQFSYKNAWDWNTYIASIGAKNLDGTWDKKKTELACHYVKNYAFSIDTLTNPRILDFDRIVRLAKKRNWNLIFNLLPENIEQAKELVGEELIQLILKNANKLVERYSRNGVMVINNIDKVEDKYFIDRNWPTEHYNENGRKIIAKNVANGLKEYYKNEYTIDTSYLEYQYSYFTNLEEEGSEPWINWNSRTTQDYYTGKFSFVVDRTNPYGLTFCEKTIRLDPQIKFLNISCNIKQVDTSSKAKLVLELRSNIINNFWDGIPLTKITNVVNKWTLINQEIRIPEQYKKAEQILVYFLNESSYPLYVDNLKINFSK